MYCVSLANSLTYSFPYLQLEMGTLQSRLDAEFLLAHMCSVKFKEWIVVLATLLRRAEVLVVLIDIFFFDFLFL